MADVLLYLEDLVKAQETVQKPKAPSASAVPATQQKQELPQGGRPRTPAPPGGWDYYTGEGTPSPDSGYQQIDGVWKKPKGAGGAKAPKPSEEAKQVAAKKTEEGTVSSAAAEKPTVTSGKAAPKEVSTTAAKRESNKRAKSPKPPQPADTPERELQRDAHKKQISTLMDNMRSHVASGKLSPDERAQLNKVADALEGQKDMTDMPTAEQKRALVSAKKIAGKYGRSAYKRPKTAKADKAPVLPQPASSPKAKTKKEKEALQNKAKERLNAMYEKAPGSDAPTPPPLPSKAQQKRMVNEVDKKKRQVDREENRKRKEAAAQQIREERAEAKKQKEAQKAEEKKQKEAAKQEAQTKREDEKKEATAQKEGEKRRRKVGRAFKAGQEKGEEVAAGAEKAEAGGELGSSAINYSTGGVVSAGHHLLGSGKKKETKEAPKEAPKKGAEVEQSSMKTQKSLGLYIDLEKAVQSPTFGVTTPTERRARIEHESSYAKRPVGVANQGIVQDDDPDKGEKWKHSDESSVDADVEEKLKKEREREDKQEEETKKSVSPVAMLKSLNSTLHAQVKSHLPTSMEATFMVDVLEYDPISVSKGQCSIAGKDRHRFNEWAADRLRKTISGLEEKVNG